MNDGRQNAARPSGDELHAWATAYIREGFAVFPVSGVRHDGTRHACARCAVPSSCKSPGKHPLARLAPKGHLDATLDPAQVERWISTGAWTGHNLGIVPGRGFLFLDPDGPEGVAELNDLQATLGPLPRTRTQATPGDGFHALYRLPPGLPEIGNSHAALGTRHVHVRGETFGWIVAAPSLHVCGLRYRWLNPGHPIAELPAAYVERLLPPEQPERPPVAARTFVGDGVGTRRGLGMLRWAVEQIKAAPEGERTNRLYVVSLSVASFVKAGELAEDTARDALLEAMLAAGLPTRKGETIRRAFKHADPSYVLEGRRA